VIGGDDMFGRIAAASVGCRFDSVRFSGFNDQADQRVSVPAMQREGAAVEASAVSGAAASVALMAAWDNPFNSLNHLVGAGGQRRVTRVASSWRKLPRRASFVAREGTISQRHSGAA
jgi:hypothetical protein